MSKNLRATTSNEERTSSVSYTIKSDKNMTIDTRKNTTTIKLGQPELVHESGWSPAEVLTWHFAVVKISLLKVSLYDSEKQWDVGSAGHMKEYFLQIRKTEA